MNRRGHRRFAALLALSACLAGCERQGDGTGDRAFVAPCIAPQRPVSMTPPKLVAPLPDGLQGTVRVDYVVERDGRVGGVEVRTADTGAPGATDGGALPPEVERAVADAVAGWRFRAPMMRCRGRMEMALAFSTSTVPAK